MHEYRVVHRGKPIEKASKAMIMLHGRGGRAEDILGLAPHFCDESFCLLAPQATNHSWYPHGFMSEEKENEPWLSSAIETVQRLLNETAEKISVESIYLLGFSQGACLSLEVFARDAKKLGGVIAFSGGLIGSEIDEKRYARDLHQTPVLIGISEHDPYIPFIRAEQSNVLLEKLNAAVTFRAYPGSSHTVNSDEINWVKTLIGK